MLRCFISIGVVGCWLASFDAFQLSAAERPNFVVFLSDDMGWGQPGFQGGTEVKTPHLDRLAAEGVNLTQFYVQSVCSPTRAAFLTGRYPFRNGMEQRTHGNDVAGMLLDERTVADVLRDAGYYTAIFGKWHLGSWHKHHLPMQRGFDRQFGQYGALIDSFTHHRDGIYDWHRNEQPLESTGYSTFEIADELVHVLAEHDATKPFFFYVPFNAVHGPHGAPPEYVQKHRGNKQHAMLECMDTAIGRICAALEQRKLFDHTLVVFFNDNGGPKGVGNGLWRGEKGTTYEGGVRVACVARWPGKIPAGSKVDEMLHVVDFYPTLVRLAGASLDQKLPLDGRDAWPTISAGKPTPHDEIVLSVPGSDTSETGPPAIRIGDFKLTGNELFDIRHDPYEKEDLAAEQPQRVAALRKRLDELAAERRTPETHGRVPGPLPAVYGEEENRDPLPAWLQKFVAERETPARSKRKRKQSQSTD